MVCRKCNRRFNLGEALQLTGTNKKANSCASKKIPDPGSGSESESGRREADPRALLKKSIRQIIEGVKTVRGVTDTIELSTKFVFILVCYGGMDFFEALVDDVQCMIPRAEYSGRCAGRVGELGCVLG